MPVTNLQNSCDFNGQKFYVGLDVHKKSWTVTIRSLGVEASHFNQPPDVDKLVAYLTRNYPGGEYFSAYEAGFCGTGTHELLCKAGITNIIIHPADLPLTDKHRKNKTDLHDSRALALNLEKGNLKGIHILSHQQQELRTLSRLRELKVKDATQANNRLKGFLMQFGIEIPALCGKSLTAKALQWLSDLELSTDAGTITLREYVADLKYRRNRVAQITKLLGQQIEATDQQTFKCLISIPGIGHITAMTLMAEIGDFSRFDDPDQYASFLGLCPWEASSADNIKTKGLQPRCNKHLRPLLMEASWVAIRRSPRLFAYYSKHSARNNKQAIVKVARKLAMIIRGVAISKQEYQTDYLPKQNQQAIKKEKPQKERFSSGITQKHINKKPGNEKASIPG